MPDPMIRSVDLVRFFRDPKKGAALLRLWTGRHHVRVEPIGFGGPVEKLHVSRSAMDLEWIFLGVPNEDFDGSPR